MAISTLFLTTCKNKYPLKRVDKDSQNFMFLVSGHEPEHRSRIWKEIDGKGQLETLNSNTLDRDRAGGQYCIWNGGRNSPFAMAFTTEDFVSTNEAYIRAVFWVPAGSPHDYWTQFDAPIITIIDSATKEVKFHLRFVWDDYTLSKTGVSLKVQFTDKTGESHEFSLRHRYHDTASSAKIIDFRAYIPENERAKFVVSSPLAQDTVLSAAEGEGFDDNNPVQAVVINSEDGVTPSEAITRFMRFGIGNRIATAKP